jgi:hypothetical protein
MQTFQFLLLTHLLEAPVLLREVTRGAFFRWLSYEHAVVTVTALYPCQPLRASVLLLSTAADSMQDSAKPVSLVIKHVLSSERIGRVRKLTGFLTVKK